jgi:hypothetical protein
VSCDRWMEPLSLFHTSTMDGSFGESFESLSMRVPSVGNTLQINSRIVCVVNEERRPSSRTASGEEDLSMSRSGASTQSCFSSRGER